MKLTSNEARVLLEKYREKTENDRWIDHCICVGNIAGKIAQALEEKGYNINIDKTITLGYLHDIGKYNGEFHWHEVRGYNYLKDKEYDTLDTLKYVRMLKEKNISILFEEETNNKIYMQKRNRDKLQRQIYCYKR